MITNTTSNLSNVLNGGASSVPSQQLPAQSMYLNQQMQPQQQPGYAAGYQQNPLNRAKAMTDMNDEFHS